ncbi:MAG: SprT-like domain-containing protein [Candidatus Woesearchaeota archaeon]
MQHTLVQKAWQTLYGHKDCTMYKFLLTYSGRFKPYNAHVKYKSPTYHFYVSRAWQSVDPLIVQGVIESLMLKVFKGPHKQPNNIALYEQFLRQLHKQEYKITDDDLHVIFDELNAQYFDHTLNTPHLQWGLESYRTLGHYNYLTDTITISRILQDAQPELLRFVMYHEMLHIKHQFYVASDGSRRYHTHAFREDERAYPNFVQIEKQLQRLCTKKKFSWF